MTAYRVIDKNQWPRKQHFDFYQTFTSPSYNLCVSLAAEPLYDCATARQESFFLLTLYAITRAANAVPQMRQRVVNGEVVEYAQIAAMTPLMTPAESFCQAWCDYAPTFSEFKRQAAPAIEQAKHSQPGPMRVDGEDFFCASCLPWLHFTAMTHAEFHPGGTLPALTWGKMERGVIPVACKFNHALVDGLHASRFFDRIAHGFQHPETLWQEEPS